MASVRKDCAQPVPSLRHIGSFVVLDLETNDLPHIFSKIAITELCMYGFSANELEMEAPREIRNGNKSPVPKRPRILHKLTLLFNPRRLIHPSAEIITGLSNYNLENESHFDENAANTILNFIKHMPQPVCLVAHNGDPFDFPIVKQTLDKFSLELPKDTLCLDSLRAFWGIDDMLKSVAPEAEIPSSQSDKAPELLPLLDFDEPKKIGPSLDTIQLAQPILNSTNGQETTTLADSKLTLVEQLEADAKVDWRARNERTPRRPTVAGVKRTRSDESTPGKQSFEDNTVFKSKRALFSSKKVDRYPPKGVYKLENLYERYFHEKPKDVHYAEADVETLMHLMQVYGLNFLAYAENHAIPFNEIKIRR
ncbi:PREDICTED: uncharacterized protein LOC108367268 [Rhagoletis zephyria]|uniref:uncharacterized protein LOC108367268 n=1 Tax=Rhagoletis zephyria TaxID=28612 RepID=UPI0008118F68|nr:PREDICTED: uncharacterized protein LOC108367268 [Rhagoletis zephyria]